MAEPLLISGAIAAVTLNRPAAREHERLKTIAYTAGKLHDSPQAARSAFFKMADVGSPESEGVERVESLPRAHVRSTSSAQPSENFVGQPVPVVPETSQQSAEGAVLSSDVPHNRSTQEKPNRMSFLSEHRREAIGSKWGAKKAKEDARYHKQCDKLNHRYGKDGQHASLDPSTEAKSQIRQQNIDAKHVKREKSLELRHCTEVSMAEWRARRKAEKRQKKGFSTENTLPADVHASTDGTGEQLNERPIRKSRLSSRHRSSRGSSSHAISPSTMSSSKPVACNRRNRALVGTIIGSGAASVACMGANFGGSVGGTGC